jgi:hypothetical protein
VKFGLAFPNSNELHLVLLRVNFVPSGLTRNETGIANNLNAIFGAGGSGLTSLPDALAGLGALAHALDQLRRSISIPRSSSSSRSSTSPTP